MSMISAMIDGEKTDLRFKFLPSKGSTIMIKGKGYIIEDIVHTMERNDFNLVYETKITLFLSQPIMI